MSDSLLRLASTLEATLPPPPPPLNQELNKLGHRSHSFCNQRLHYIVHECLTARTSTNTSRRLRHPPVKLSTAQPGHRSSSFCHQCVHIIDYLQQHLQPDHTATPNICTKHRDHPYLLDALSTQTVRQLSIRLSAT